MLWNILATYISPQDKSSVKDSTAPFNHAVALKRLRQSPVTLKIQFSLCTVAADVGQKDNFIKTKAWSSVNKAIDLTKLSPMQPLTVLQLSNHDFQIISCNNKMDLKEG